MEAWTIKELEKWLKVFDNPNDLKEQIMIKAFYNHTPINALKWLMAYARVETKRINEEKRK